MKFISCMVTHDRPKQAIQTLQSLVFQTRPPDGIVIVENSSSCYRMHDDPMFVCLTNWAVETGINVHFSLHMPLGMVGARIECERIAVSLYPDQQTCFMVVDDDHIYVPDWVERVTKALEEFDVAGGHMCSMRSKEKMDSLTFFSKNMISPNVFHGGCFAYRSKFVGLFSRVIKETENIGEDQIWQILAKESGARYPSKDFKPPMSLHTDMFWKVKYPASANKWLENRRGEIEK